MTNNNRSVRAEDPKDLTLRMIEMERAMCKGFLSDLQLLKDESEKLEMLQEIRKIMEKCAVAEHFIIESHRAASEATREVSQEMEACKDSGSVLSPAETFLQMYTSLFEEKMNIVSDDEIAANDMEVQVVKEEIQAIVGKFLVVSL
ncbi:uncharacterized protein [Palaemon carinicauda]|uniref:uncharacterized protein n=1 Tax=Palaemon carinicauda TaxID=392227 RepID=UPI0035B6A3B1